MDHFIVVLNDRETWTELEGCSVMKLSDLQFKEVLDGGKPKDLRDVEVLDIQRLLEKLGRIGNLIFTKSGKL